MSKTQRVFSRVVAFFVFGVGLMILMEANNISSQILALLDFALAGLNWELAEK